ncbi:MAG: hypothetical protein WBQ73_02385 [Candidatus Babeliales bacterium]
MVMHLSFEVSYGERSTTHPNERIVFVVRMDVLRDRSVDFNVIR